MTLKARVHQGRLVVDEPTSLPEGTEVDLLPLDPGDWLDPADRARLLKEWWRENSARPEILDQDLSGALFRRRR